MIFQRLSQAAFLVALFGLAALTLSPKPPASIASTDDFVLHFGGYFVLAGFAAFGWPMRLALIAVALPVLGFGLELAQIPVPGRAFEWSDALANTFGAVAGVVIGWLLALWRASAS